LEAQHILLALAALAVVQELAARREAVVSLEKLLVSAITELTTALAVAVRMHQTVELVLEVSSTFVVESRALP
jgi:hypothetical protein